MRYVVVLVYGCVTLLLFALGAVMGFVGFASIAWLLTASESISNLVGAVAAIVFGVLFGYSFFVDLRSALERIRLGYVVQLS